MSAWLSWELWVPELNFCSLYGLELAKARTCVRFRRQIRQSCHCFLKAFGVTCNKGQIERCLVASSSSPLNIQHFLLLVFQTSQQWPQTQHKRLACRSTEDKVTQKQPLSRDFPVISLCDICFFLLLYLNCHKFSDFKPHRFILL